MTKRAEFHDKQLEALRQKEMAEKMIKLGDYASARNKLLEAQDFSPLDHIVPMLTVCEILSASSFQISGCDIDYYMILRLVPSSTAEDIDIQYKKLQSFLKPIKESFPGTELALKFIQEAFSVLSDKDGRAAFDSRRKTLWEAYESSSPAVKPVSLPNVPGNKVGNAAGVSSSKCKKYSSESSEEGIKLESKMVEIIDLDSPDEACKVLNQDFYNFDEDRKIENMEEGQIWATHHYESNYNRNPSRYAQIMTKSVSKLTVMRLKPTPVSEREKRWCEAGIPVSCGSFSLDLDSGEMSSSPMEFSHKCTWNPGLKLEQFSIYPRKGEVWAIYGDWNLEKWSKNHELIKSCKYKLVEILSDFSKYTGSDCAILVKVEGFRSIFQRQRPQDGIPICIIHLSPTMLYLLSHKVPSIRLTGTEIDGVKSGMLELDHLAVPNDIRKSETSACKPHKGRISRTQSSSCANAFQGNDTATGQVWAIYCGKESMPRQYVVIDKVISRTQARVTFLEPETTTEVESSWKRKNLPIACGTFRAGGTTVNFETSQLSHLVRFEKSMFSYKIYPAKGEIWAMYERWNSKWELSDQESCHYWIVEILSDFSEEGKIMVARLKEVKGCLSFFHRLQSNGFSLISEVSRTEILSFSHRISFCKVPGIGYHGIPDDSCHLEPNDLPLKRSKLT